MKRDENWPKVCTLQGCNRPKLRPHHHHYVRGDLNNKACKCEFIDQAGTKPLDKRPIGRNNA